MALEKKTRKIKRSPDTYNTTNAPKLTEINKFNTPKKKKRIFKCIFLISYQFIMCYNIDKSVGSKRKKEL